MGANHHFVQHDHTHLKDKDSGLKCLRSLARHHGKIISLQTLRTNDKSGHGADTLRGLAEMAENIGFRARCVTMNFSALKRTPLPCIIKWNGYGFVVVSAIVQNQIAIGTDRETVTVSSEEFFKNWLGDVSTEGLVLLLEPTPAFFSDRDVAIRENTGLSPLFSYLKKHPRLVRQLIIGIFIGTLLKITPPFLTQSIVDTGIINSNLNFIYIILAAQLMLMVGRNSMEAIRGWLLLYVSSRVSISLLTDFMAKIMRLPVSFFNEKAQGDLVQRVEDQKRIEQFLSTQLAPILFALVNIAIYTVIFAIYDGAIFSIFIGATLLYIGWVAVFMKRRRLLDSTRFETLAQERNKLLQIVQGMPDIKMANAEMPKRWDWEQLRAQVFRQNVRMLSLSQMQQIGGLVINETKNILITFLSAKAVLDGQLSLGAMLAMQQMLGQTNGPIEQIVLFMQQWQDARLSMERMNDIHRLPDEEPEHSNQAHQLPAEHSIALRNISFKYPNSSATVLRNVQLYIPQGKTTAIIGGSGSGKTTLLKMLLKHYEPGSGEIAVGNTDLRHLANQAWRSHCGVVNQEGFVFSDTIMSNIALGDDEVDIERLHTAARVANLHDFIQSLPMGYHTPVGGEHGAMSQGQKQRLLIARAVYKNPEYLFFDEGTSALDTQNQQIIMQNLREFFKGRTMVVVAHRLSTIRHADQIVVIEQGQVLEKGTHDELVALRGRYYELLTNQLEMAA